MDSHVDSKIKLHSTYISHLSLRPSSKKLPLSGRWARSVTTHFKKSEIIRRKEDVDKYPTRKLHSSHQPHRPHLGQPSAEYHISSRVPY